MCTLEVTSERRLLDITLFAFGTFKLFPYLTMPLEVSINVTQSIGLVLSVREFVQYSRGNPVVFVQVS